MVRADLIGVMDCLSINCLGREFHSLTVLGKKLHLYALVELPKLIKRLAWEGVGDLRLHILVCHWAENTNMVYSEAFSSRFDSHASINVVHVICPV